MFGDDEAVDLRKSELKLVLSLGCEGTVLLEPDTIGCAFPIVEVMCAEGVTATVGEFGVGSSAGEVCPAVVARGDCIGAMGVSKFWVLEADADV